MNSLIDIFIEHIDRAISTIVRLHLAELSLKYDFINWIFFIILAIPLIYAKCKNFSTKFSFYSLVVIFAIFIYLCIFNLKTKISFLLCIVSIILIIFVIYNAFAKKQILNQNQEYSNCKKPKKQKKQKVKFDKPKSKFSLKNIKFKNNKPLNLLLAIVLLLSQTTLQASLLPNFQISRSITNPHSIGKTINLSNKKDTTITGSNLIANNDININTNNLNINASQDTYNYNDKSKELSGSIDYTIYGGGGGTLGLNYSQSHSDQENLINNNSQIIA
ncbi:MAG: hemagglutinin repeat-containing protein, partial [Campylobacter sp.]|nr:hemagglutinin repeat-containing protein [Campylobacter sp.]